MTISLNLVEGEGAEGAYRNFIFCFSAIAVRMLK